MSRIDLGSRTTVSVLSWAVPLSPVFACLAGATVAQQKCQRLLPNSHELHRCINPRSREITHCFVSLVRHHPRARLPERCRINKLLGIALSVLIRSLG